MRPIGRHELDELLRETIKPRAEWAVELKPSTNYRAMDAQWREDAALARGRHRQVERSRHRNRHDWLTDKHQELLRTKTVKELLHDLSDDQGMTWVDMSRMLGVSVPALRKWRRQAASPRRTEAVLLSSPPSCRCLPTRVSVIRRNGSLSRWLTVSR